MSKGRRLQFPSYYKAIIRSFITRSLQRVTDKLLRLFLFILSLTPNKKPGPANSCTNLTIRDKGEDEDDDDEAYKTMIWDGGRSWIEGQTSQHQRRKIMNDKERALLSMTDEMREKSEWCTNIKLSAKNTFHPVAAFPSVF